MKKVTVLILALVALLFAVDQASAVSPKWKIKGVDKGKEKDVSGKLISMAIVVASKGPVFTGTMNVAFEVTDRTNAKRFYTKSVQEYGGSVQEYGGEGLISTRVFYLEVDGMENPALSGYSVQLFIPGQPEAADEKNFKCASKEELFTRNATSKKMAPKPAPGYPP